MANQRERPSQGLIHEWEVNRGQRQGLARMAHLFCEVVTRLERVGRAQEDRCTFPVTHVDLADALGMTTVHVSRVLSELRHLRLVSFSHGQLGHCQKNPD